MVSIVLNVKIVIRKLVDVSWMVQEITPEYLWFNGKLTKWPNAKVHIWSEVAKRGANVFDGIRAFWLAESATYNLLGVDEHLARLYESAALLQIPVPYRVSELKEGIMELVKALDFREHLWVRPTIYIDAGRYGYDPESTETGAYIVAFPVGHSDTMDRGITCCVSSWRRSQENSMSPRIKAGSSYMTFRLPRIEAQRLGYDEALLLNERGTVAEASGASVFVIKSGVAYTPPLYSDILESLTRTYVMQLLEQMGVRVVEREIARTELYVADEIFLCGTLSEIQPVAQVDFYPLKSQVGPITSQLINRYLAICDKGESIPEGWMTGVSVRKLEGEE